MAPISGNQSPYLVYEPRRRTALALNIIFLIVPFIFVVLRICARWTSKKGVGWDDYMMILAMTATISANSLFFVDYSYGFGKPVPLVPIEDLSGNIHYGFLQSELHLTAMFCVKCSVAIFLLRLGGLSKWLRNVLISDLALLGVSTVVTFVMQSIQCSPVSKQWNREEPGTCLSSNTLTTIAYVEISMSIITDFLCALLPWPIVYNLNVPPRTKASLLALLCLGMFVAICPIVELSKVKELAGGPSYGLVPLLSWSCVERGLAIICGSCPPIRALVLRYTQKLPHTKASTTSASTGPRTPHNRASLWSPTAGWQKGAMFDDVQTPTSPWRKNTTDDTVVFDILHSPTLPPQSPMGIRTRDTLNRPLPATPSIPEVTELSPINPVPVEAPNNQDPPPFSPGPSSSRRPDRSSRWGSFSLWRGKSAITDDEDNLRDQASPLGHTEEGFDTVVDGHRQRHSSSSSRGMPLGRLSHYSVAPPYKSRPASKVVDGIAELEAGPSEVEPRPESIMEDPTITDGDHRPDGPSSGQAPNRSSMYKGQWNGR